MRLESRPGDELVSYTVHIQPNTRGNEELASNRTATCSVTANPTDLSACASHLVLLLALVLNLDCRCTLIVNME